MQGRICIHLFEIICSDIVLKFCRHQGCRHRGSQWGATGANAPARLSKAPENLLLACLCWVAVANFPGMRIRPPAANWSLSKYQGAQQDQIPSRGALELARSYTKSSWDRFWGPWGPRCTEGRGPSLMHSSWKILAKYMVGIQTTVHIYVLSGTERHDLQRRIQEGRTRPCLPKR